MRAFENHHDGRTELTLGTSSHKHGCGVVAFRLNIPCREAHFLSEELGCRFRNLSCDANYKGTEMAFPWAGWVSSHKISFIWKLLVKLWKRVMRQRSDTVSSLLFCSEAGEKWGVETKLISISCKRSKWLVFFKVGSIAFLWFYCVLILFLWFVNGLDCFSPFTTVWGGLAWKFSTKAN